MSDVAAFKNVCSHGAAAPQGARAKRARRHPRDRAHRRANKRAARAHAPRGARAGAGGQAELETHLEAFRIRGELEVERATQLARLQVPPTARFASQYNGVSFQNDNTRRITGKLGGYASHEIRLAPREI